MRILCSAQARFPRLQASGRRRTLAADDPEDAMPNLPRLLLLLCLTTALAPAFATGTVQVSYEGADRFADAGRTLRDVEATERVLTAWLQALGKRRLADGQTLKIVITDIDLAGELRVGARGDTRVTTGGADWPRLTLHYTLEGGAAPASADEVVADKDYLRRTEVLPSDPLRYEKRMLDHWFTARFAEGRSAP